MSSGQGLGVRRKREREEGGVKRTRASHPLSARRKKGESDSNSKSMGVSPTVLRSDLFFDCSCGKHGHHPSEKNLLQCDVCKAWVHVKCEDTLRSRPRPRHHRVFVCIKCNSFRSDIHNEEECFANNLESSSRVHFCSEPPQFVMFSKRASTATMMNPSSYENGIPPKKMAKNGKGHVLKKMKEELVSVCGEKEIERSDILKFQSESLENANGIHEDSDTAKEEVQPMRMEGDGLDLESSFIQTVDFVSNSPSVHFNGCVVEDLAIDIEGDRQEETLPIEAMNE